jgi:hypothetical protein
MSSLEPIAPALTAESADRTVASTTERAEPQRSMRRRRVAVALTLLALAMASVALYAATFEVRYGWGNLDANMMGVGDEPEMLWTSCGK